MNRKAKYRGLKDLKSVVMQKYVAEHLIATYRKICRTIVKYTIQAFPDFRHFVEAMLLELGAILVMAWVMTL